MESYILHVAGVDRRMPIRRISPHLRLASFIMMGDTELIEACARELCKKLPTGLEYLVCPEAKAIALTHAMARILGLNYIVIRKSVKAYMEQPLTVEVKSITTTEIQHLVLDNCDAAKVKGKKVAIIDDVVSTGGSLDSMERLLSRAGAIVTAKAAPIWQQGGFDGKDLLYLTTTPVFHD
ncbi:MAG: adenine phosphoribosyltransferase [Acidaminococcaceae bacterium]|nr:adenine phosphoribosyltransferase [Acidaminococcaceae bacterium]MCI2110720.1 adenine phosphoribosyltransferase [Acidaminococcaceae bacterium]